MVDFEPTLDVQVSQGFTYGRMNDLVDGQAILHIGVDDAVVVLKERGEMAAGEITVLVDRCRQNCAAILAVPGGVIGATTEERDAKWGSADNHGFPLYLCALHAG